MCFYCSHIFLNLYNWWIFQKPYGFDAALRPKFETTPFFSYIIFLSVGRSVKKISETLPVYMIASDKISLRSVFGVRSNDRSLYV